MITSILGGVVFDSGYLASAASSISTGNILNGDKDGWYTVILRNIYDTADSTAQAYFNTDSTASNYGYRGISANNSTVANISSTSATIRLAAVASGSTSGFSVIRFYAKQGAVRLANGTNVCNINGTTVTQLETIGSAWNNTNTNITSMTFAPSAGNFGVGTRIIILKSDNFTESAWVRVGSQVLGAPATSVTFSGLDGDRDVLYFLKYQIKAVDDLGGVNVLFNSDLTNYGRQFLYAFNTTVSASRQTGGGIYGSNAATASAICSGTHLIFAKQGFYRPVISELIYNIGGTTIEGTMTVGQSWSITNTNLTNINILHVNSGQRFATGSQFDLYALRPSG